VWKLNDKEIDDIDVSANTVEVALLLTILGLAKYLLLMASLDDRNIPRRKVLIQPVPYTPHRHDFQVEVGPLAVHS
jgi:hypothetical protein